MAASGFPPRAPYVLATLPKDPRYRKQTATNHLDADISLPETLSVEALRCAWVRGWCRPSPILKWWNISFFVVFCCGCWVCVFECRGAMLTWYVVVWWGYYSLLQCYSAQHNMWVRKRRYVGVCLSHSNISSVTFPFIHYFFYLMQLLNVGFLLCLFLFSPFQYSIFISIHPKPMIF